MTDITATIGGISFSTAVGTTGFTLRDLDGWYSGPPVRSIVEARPNADGAFGVTRIYKGARVITQSGLIMGATTDDAIALQWRQFAGLQANGATSTYSVTDALGTLSCTVSLADAPQIVPIANGLAQYVLQMVARDPIKYGPLLSLSTALPSSGGGLEYPLHSGGTGGALYYGSVGNLGRLVLSNEGTADTWPTFEVTGTLDSGFFIQALETGQVIRYERVVPAGTTISINSRTGAVLVDGSSDASTYVTRDDFFAVPAGGSVTVQFNSIGSSSGTPTLTARTRSGWW